ncbi:hypothetical protein LJC71_03915 [Desulfosarcina sp. OttesenSCG-928-A07]|nr:hypothetical protein [Desulfosarcina sp. OttesenSCG-928-A07]
MKKHINVRWLSLAGILLLIAGCNVLPSYRPADTPTIQDFSSSGRYRKQIGVMALTNTTLFASSQASAPFMEAFLSELASTVPDAILLTPGKPDTPAFLLNPPRLSTGEVDAFAFSALARQAGMSAVVSPVLMDVRVRKETSGLWIFRSVDHYLRIQVAAAVYDPITGSRITLERLTQEISIDEDLAGVINTGRETAVPGLEKTIGKMGKELGEQMGETISRAPLRLSVIAVENSMCVIPAGSLAGISQEDRFAVIDNREVLAGWNEQRYRVPGVKIGGVRVIQVTPEKSFAVPESGDPPPVGSIVVPGT